MNPLQLLAASLLEDSRWIAWTAVVVIGLPVAMIVLDELAGYFRQREDPLAGPVLLLRNVVAPGCGFLILLVEVLRLPLDRPSVRIIVTLVSIAVLYAGLALVNGILFRDDELRSRKATAGPRSSIADPAVPWQSRVPRLVRDLIRLALVAIGALVVLSRVWQLNVSGLFTALGISSIVLGLALQEPLGNALSGALLLIRQPFKVGDWVRASGDIGQVKEITWHSTIIQTQQNEIKVVPNALLAKAVVGNYTGADNCRIKPIALTFPATVPPNQVDEALTRIACDIPGVLAEPAPNIVVIGVRGTNLSYTVSFCVATYEAMDEVRGIFLKRLWYASRRPRTGLPPVGVADSNAPIVADGVVRSRLDAFSLFTRLTPEGRDEVASRAELEIYAAGERIQTEGTMSVGVRFVLSGRVCLLVAGPGGTPLEVECLDRGGIFGETGPGELCSMTAAAATDVEVLSLDYTCLNVVLRHAPSLVRDVVRTVEAFQRGAAAARQAAEVQQATPLLRPPAGAPP